MELALTGDNLPAERAHKLGLVNVLADPGKALDEAIALAEKIAANAPISVRQAKKSLNMAEQIDLRNGYDYEIEAYNRMVPTDDRLEGVRAFN